ncbi:DegT/DnrJ/EryC1/StrS family aminotransferase [Paenibacillus agricola]|uniref:DegT/DnrJ/EryC1/StrS family aminotransferase n=1 Tax=Paenibacillus agricola TaxID=2716264 RepID=A0ABX0JCS5_9BACL|nr:DegT/DnrJ/EryC1/StrS family aminotransferase [Paenibacillus agricola]NHN34282.1 DegT/DnrJ/EryC1/StrS family aminotransferase [Paenibacillus agricola]
MNGLKLATEAWDHKEYEAIDRVIKSNWFTMGPEVEKFEKEFAEYFGCNYAVMVNSGSSANLLAISALFYSKKYKLKRGDEVLVPAVSWATTFTPLQQYGLKVRFVDIDIDTLNMDINKLEAAITSNTKAIFSVNLLGNPVDYKKVLDIANKYNLIVLEDNCESMGAKLNGKYAGTFGVMGTFSTFFSHHISTMEGGVIITNDKEIKDILVSLRAHGWTRGLSEDSEVYVKDKDPFYESFNFILPGYNVRPLEIEAAIGQEQLKKLGSLIEVRRNNGHYFQQIFSKVPYIRIQKQIGESSYFGFSIVLTDEAPFTRNTLVKIFRENKIECRPIVAGNFIKNDVIKYFDFSIYDTLVNADYIHENGLFIGNHHINIEKELDAVLNLIKNLE